MSGIEPEPSAYKAGARPNRATRASSEADTRVTDSPPRSASLRFAAGLRRESL